MTIMLRRLAASVLAAAIISALSLGLLASSAPAAPLTVGNLVVERIGDGSTTLTGNAFPVAVLEYAPGGSLAQTIAFPTTGGDQQSDSGSATSNGYLNSFNGFISVPGSNSAVGTAGVASLNAKVNSTIGTSGTVVNRTLFPTGGPTGTPPSPFSGNNYRSSIATSGSTFYATGAASGSPNTGGAWYFDGTAFTQVSSTATGQPTNARNVEIYNNQLYLSSGAATGYGIWAVGAGLPTAAGQSSTFLINSSAVGAGNGSPYGFVMFDTNNDNTLDLAYLADDRTTVGGGLQKWTFNGTSWSNSWALLVNASNNLSATAGAGFAGLRGLTGSYAGGTATLFATTTETSNNRLISIIDAGSTPTAATGVATAGANYVFRGVDVVTVPEPSTLASLGCAAALYAILRRRRAA
jgi:hypothetical protein